MKAQFRRFPRRVCLLIKISLLWKEHFPFDLSVIILEFKENDEEVYPSF